MKLSAVGRRKLIQREGSKTKAYKDSVGVWTIGVGHTAAAGPPAPKRGLEITTQEVDALLAKDIVQYENAVNRAVKVQLSQGEFDALVSFCFNIGTGAFSKSTLVKKLNAGDRDGAARAFMMWVKPPEITGRRKTEQQQFIDAGAPTTVAPRFVEHEIEDDDPPPTKTPDGADLNVQPQTAAYSVDVRAVQGDLIKVGYHEVGGADGRWGGMTAAGIAAFKNDRGMKGEPVIDAALKAELSKAISENWTRPIAPERANLSAKDVAEKEPAVKQSLWQRLGAKWTAGVGVVGAAWNGVTSYFSDLREKVAPVQDFFTDIPGWVWFVGLIGGAALLWLSANKATTNLVDAKRTGKLS